MCFIRKGGRNEKGKYSKWQWREDQGDNFQGRTTSRMRAETEAEWKNPSDSI